MLAPLQLNFPATDRRLRVLVTISGARQWESFRGCNEDALLAPIDAGLLVAFNIALQLPRSDDPNPTKRELRIFPDSLEWFSKNKENPKAGQNPFFDTWEHLILSGHQDATISTPRASVILNCSSTHIINLIDSGALTSVINYGRGPKGAAAITRDSFLAFLKSRIEGGS